MKKLILAVLMLFSTSSFAAPFLYSDPDPTGASDICGYTLNSGVDIETTVVNGGCKIDLANFPDGDNNMEVWFKSSLWGVESARIPFAFNKPASGAAGPNGILIGR